MPGLRAGFSWPLIKCKHLNPLTYTSADFAFTLRLNKSQEMNTNTFSVLSGILMGTFVSFWQRMRWFLVVLYADHVCAERPAFAALLKAFAILKDIGKFLKFLAVTRPLFGPYFDFPGIAFGENIFSRFPVITKDRFESFS